LNQFIRYINFFHSFSSIKPFLYSFTSHASVFLTVRYSCPYANNKGKGKAVLLQAWSGPEGSRMLRFPDFMTMAQDGGKVVSLTHRPPLLPENTPGTHFC